MTALPLVTYSGTPVSEPATQSCPRTTAWIALLVIGAIGGVLSGLFAIGGAILMVPLLVWRAGMDQRRAAATSLVAIIPTAVVSSATYLAFGSINVVAAVLLSAGGIIGAGIGTRLLRRLPMVWLRWLLIGFLLAVAAYMLMAVPERAHEMALSPWVALGYITLGVFTGVASGLFGIGGAIIAVPMLMSIFAFSDLVAKGTALLFSIPTSVSGTVSNHRSGGPVDVRAGLVLGAAAAVTSVPAVHLAVVLPAGLSGVLFATLLFTIAGQLAAKAGR